MQYRPSPRFLPSLATLAALSITACATGGGSGDTGPPRIDARIEGIDAPMVEFPDVGPLPDTGPLPDAFVVPDGGSDAGPLCVDEDSDGFLLGPAECGDMIDCDDGDDAVNPGAVESCNLVDDDCNGSVDDAIPEQTCGVGACEATVPGCTRGMVPACEPGGPSREECNAVDDDCDGTTDEGFDAPIVCGVGACQRMVPACGGGSMMTCTPGMPGTETCNGMDDDCDGVVDDGLPTATCGVGGCMRTVPTCVGGMPQACTPLAPGTEICNGVDDDCDGTTDDGFGTVTCGMGVCQRTVLECVSGTPATCAPGAAGTETCNNLDDNCNGTPDDGLGSSSCGLGACARTVMNCIAGVPQTCSPGSPSGEVCNGTDDDCNGSVDDMGSTSCGTGLCARTVTNCVGGVPQSCVPGASSPEVCGNGLDENCNGTPDDGCVTAPANDLCTAPTALSLGSSSTSVTGTTVGATNQVSGGCGCSSGSDVFYSFTLAQTEYVWASTLGGASWDTSLFFTDSGCTALAARSAPESVCNDDGGTASCGSLQSQIFAVLGAGTYRLGVSGCGSGTFTLNFAHFPVGAEGNGGAVAAGSSTLSGSIVTAGTGITLPSCSGSGRERSYHWVTCPSYAGGSLTASMCGGPSPWDTYLALYHSNAAAQCDDDSCGGVGYSLLSGVAQPAGAGLHVLYVDAYSSFGSGAYSVAMTRP